MIKKITKFLNYDIVSNSLYIVIASVVGSFLAFILNLFLTRKLTYAEYGAFASLASFVGLASIPTQTISATIIQYAGSYFAKKQNEKAVRLYWKSLKYLGFLSICIFLFFFLSSKLFSSFLNINDKNYIVVTAVIISFVYLNIVNSSMLQSLLRFKTLSIIGIVANVTKLLFGILFITLGFRLFGALWGLFFSVAIQFFISFIPLRFVFNHSQEHIDLSKKELFFYGTSVVITTLSLSSFISTDLILVKHFFSPHEAGLYAGLALVGKVIFYLTAPISTVMFPLLINKHNQGMKVNGILYGSIALVSVPSAFILVFYYFFPHFTVEFFLGNKGYQPISGLVWFYGFYMSLYGILNIFITFFLSIKNRFILYPVFVAALAQILLIYCFHHNFFQVILSSTIVESILLLAILVFIHQTLWSKGVRKKTSSL